jgi:hypothetical protein
VDAAASGEVIMDTSERDAPRIFVALEDGFVCEDCLPDELRARLGDADVEVWAEGSDGWLGPVVCRACGRRIPVVVDGFEVHLDNRDGEDGGVTLYVRGSGAAVWARADQSIAGARWECDGDDFAYAIVVDHPDLVHELESAGYRLDTDHYDAPGGELTATEA